ncbi:MAG: HAMP domain-containing protein [Nitrospiraceae bacterium]|nr:MAG: HAMP domain-containing protein [Nitrospiraceae bacterium]
MFTYQPSIAQKITLGYYVIGSIFISLIIINFIGLRYMEKKIAFDEAISGFSNTILEIRRSEKNYFLYSDQSDYHENRIFIDRAQHLLKNNIHEFTALVQPAKVALLEKSIGHYMDIMEQYHGLMKADIPDVGMDVTNQRKNLENDIKKSGQEILSIADDLLVSEQRKMQTFLSRTQLVLLILAVVLSFLGIVVCQILSKRVVKPLKSVTNSLRRIGDGKLEHLDIESGDREIISLKNAFNKMLEELHLRQRHLVQSEKLASLGTLLSGVAHELNNPLSNISSSSQILTEELEETDNEYKRELLSQIEEQTDKARNIVRSLLEFSRDKEFDKEKIRLRELLEKTVQFVKGDIPTKVLVNLDVSDSVVIYADKQRIQQAFLNLLLNAAEAIKESGAIFIKAKVLRMSDKIDPDDKPLYDRMKYCGAEVKADHFVDIQIADTGKGIPDEQLTRIFDPFFSTKEEGGGLGLGLFIVHEIIEEHQGCIAVASTEGEGTTFLIRLPLPDKT